MSDHKEVTDRLRRERAEAMERRQRERAKILNKKALERAQMDANRAKRKAEEAEIERLARLDRDRRDMELKARLRDKAARIRENLGSTSQN